MSSSDSRFDRDCKLVFGFFDIHAVGLLIPNEIMKLSVKFFHIIMKWDKHAEDCIATENIIAFKEDHGYGWRVWY